MHPFINIATQAARSASRIMLSFVDRLDELKVSKKGMRDLVSKVDEACEQEIIAQIQKTYPNHNILGEESGLINHDSDYTWVIDPLDGTMNFLHGMPHFCISIAVKKGDTLEAACIYDPLRQELFTAVKGKGARLNDRRIRVSDIKNLSDSLVGTEFSGRDETLFEPQQKIYNQAQSACAEIRLDGTAALALAYVAAGRLDAFWCIYIKEWDIAAGELLVREAGGFTTSLRGGAGIVAGNAKTHQALLDIVKTTI